MPIKTIICDRDGTLIEDKHYLANAKEVELLPSVAQGIILAKKAGLFIGIVSNQSGVGRGYFSCSEVDACNTALLELLHTACNEANVSIMPIINSIEYCPHTPEEQCRCRKPMLGMWEAMQNKYMCIAQESVMLGDKKEDIAFGVSAGMPYVFLLYTGKGSMVQKELGIAPHKGVKEITKEYSMLCGSVGRSRIFGANFFIEAIQMICTIENYSIESYSIED